MAIKTSALKHASIWYQYYWYQQIQVSNSGRYLNYILLFKPTGLHLFSLENVNGKSSWTSAVFDANFAEIGASVELQAAPGSLLNENPFVLFPELPVSTYHMDGIIVDKLAFKNRKIKIEYYRIHVDINEYRFIMKFRYVKVPDVVWHPVGYLSPGDRDFISSMITEFEDGTFHKLQAQSEFLQQIIEAMQQLQSQRRPLTDDQRRVKENADT